MARDSKTISKIASDAASKKLKGKESVKNKRKKNLIKKIPEHKRTRFQNQLMKYVPTWRVKCPVCGCTVGEYQYKKDVPSQMPCDRTKMCKPFWSKSIMTRIEGTVVVLDNNTPEVVIPSEKRIEFTRNEKDSLVRMVALGLTRDEISSVLGVSPSTISNLMDVDQKLSRSCEAAKSSVKYTLLSKAFDLAEGGNVHMLSFLLKTKYGFSQKLNIDHGGSSVSVAKIDYSKLSVDELKVIRNVLEKHANQNVIDVESSNV